MELQQVTEVTVSRGYGGLHGVAGGYKSLQGLTRCYEG